MEIKEDDTVSKELYRNSTIDTISLSLKVFIYTNMKEAASAVYELIKNSSLLNNKGIKTKYSLSETYCVILG